MQSLVDTGALAGTRGRYRLVASPAGASVPPTVQALLAARIDRLPEREKAVLQTAAVVGREFTPGIVERAADLPADELAPALDAADRQRVRETDGVDATVAVEAALVGAASLVAETGARYQAPFVHLARARLAALAGDGVRRVAELRQAATLFDAIGAPARAAATARAAAW